jgi:hypothetical protein
MAEFKNMPIPPEKREAFPLSRSIVDRSPLSPKPQVSVDEQLSRSHNDKQILIAQLGCLVDRGLISFNRDLLILSEGCDNADYLGLLIPYLRSLRGIGTIKVLLTNCSETKLQSAQRFTSLFVGPENVDFLATIRSRGRP